MMLNELITLIFSIDLLISSFTGAFKSTALIVLNEEVRFHNQLTSSRGILEQHHSGLFHFSPNYGRRIQSCDQLSGEADAVLNDVFELRA